MLPPVKKPQQPERRPPSPPEIVVRPAGDGAEDPPTPEGVTPYRPEDAPERVTYVPL